MKKEKKIKKKRNKREFNYLMIRVKNKRRKILNRDKEKNRQKRRGEENH